MGAAALLGGKKPVVAMASTKVITTRAKVGLTVKVRFFLLFFSFPFQYISPFFQHEAPFQAWDVL